MKKIKKCQNICFKLNPVNVSIFSDCHVEKLVNAEITGEGGKCVKWLMVIHGCYTAINIALCCLRQQMRISQFYL